MSNERRSDGLEVITTNRSVSEVMDRMQALATARGLTVFGRINFAADAERVGLKLPPIELIMVGNPKAGTPLIMSAPTVAIDLPLRVLAWKDGHGETNVAIDEPSYLQTRHGFSVDLVKNIAGLSGVVAAAVGGDQ